MEEAWQSGIAYERFMGRWSGPVAQEFLSWLGVPPGRSWLDVGCGTGSLSRLIIEKYQPKELTALDASADFIAHAQRAITDPAAHFKVGLAQALELDSNRVEAVVSGLVLNFVPQPKTALQEMLRVCKSGGRIGIFVWDYAQGMQMLRHFWDAATQLEPGAREQDEGLRFPLCQEAALAALARESGLKQVETRAIEVRTIFKDFDDYWQPFLGGAGPASGYTLNLTSEARQRLADQLRRSLPTDQQGAIHLTARAWALKGKA